ncbi:MAG: rhomboid family intramembrane serine protease [Candidatus Altiarchaeota archaeon]
MRVAGSDIKVVEGLIALNGVVFIMSMANQEMVFQNMGMSFSSFFIKPWTIITSMFVHAGFHHILWNMIGLFMFSMYLERLIGEKILLKIYMIGGICGGLLYLFTAMIGLAHPNTIVVGASGAIFALGATLAVLRPNIQIYLFPIPFPMPLYVAVFFFMVVMSFQPGVAWAGHFGGLAAGVYFGFQLKKQTPEYQIITPYGRTRYY